MNQYHIYEAIGRGKHSTVYKGRKKKSIEYFAIKSVEKVQKTRVLQEVRTLHSLDHHNVLKFYAWYETSAHLWLVLEYCVGGDLLTLLRQDTRLPESSIHDFARDLVQALQFLHSKGVVYCDLKPSNVLLDENGRLKLCDFGLARRLTDIAKSSVQQLPQSKRGTPCYMAPELFHEAGVHSFGSDLWALGCIMYECCAGRPPFVSSSFTELVNSILYDSPPPFRGSPTEEFKNLVNRLLVKDPARRIQWEELRGHPFWRTKFQVVPLPPQPALASFLRHNRRHGSPGKDPSADRQAPTHTQSPDKRLIQQRTMSRRADAPVGRNLASEQALHAAVQVKDAGPVENLPLSQPLSDRRVNGATDASPLKEGSARTNAGVNLLRLSRIVKSNLQKDVEGENYRQAAPNTSVGNDVDVTLAHNDLELDFGEGAGSDVAEDEDDSIGCPSAPPPVAFGDQQIEQLVPLSVKLSSEKLPSSKIQESPSKPAKTNGKGCDLSKPLELETQLEALRLDVTATPPGIGITRKLQRVAATSGEPKKVTPSSVLPAAIEPVKASVVLSQLLWHQSDLAVRPIMINKKAEKASDSTFDARALPVDFVQSSDFVKLSPDMLDSFLNRLIASINGNTTLNEKLNTLKFVESLCTNIDASNLLINGSLMPLLVKMLRTMKQPAIRVQITTVMGLLIRHATLIEDELASSGIIAVLTETLRDKQEKVRRCAMATLGELMFYISTQSEGSPRSGVGHDSPAKDTRSSPMWQVPSTTIALVASILRRGEDDVTQHYALKTIENIASQGGEWATRFTSHEVLENLCHTFKSSGKPESLRATAGSCLVRLLRFSPSTLPVVLDKISFKDVVAGLSRGSLREQQISLNLLNMALAGSSVINNMGKYLLALLEEKTLVPSIVSLLEQGMDVLRGKAFICAALLCKVNRRWLPSLCNAKLVPAVERSAKDKDSYVQHCVEALVQTIATIVPGILESVSADIVQLSTLKRPVSVASGHGSGRPQPRSSIPFLPVVLHILNCPTFRSRVVSEHVVRHLVGFMEHVGSVSFQGQYEFQSTLLQIIEILSQQSSVVLGYPQIFIEQALPSLGFLYRKSTDGDTRFLCFKIFFDILGIFLDGTVTSEPISCPSPTTGTTIEPTSMKQLEPIIGQHFLPLYPRLIEDEDPIPMYAQKLLVMLLDLECINISDILQLKLVSQFFEFLSDDLSTINLHNVRLSLFLASAPEVGTGDLSNLNVISRLGALLEFVHVKGMEDFLDPVLCLSRCFLSRNVANTNMLNIGGKQLPGNGAEHTENLIQDISDFGRYSGVFLELCQSSESRIVEMAANCVFMLVKAAPWTASRGILSNMLRIAQMLESAENCHGPALTVQLQYCLLYALSFACKEQRSLSTNSVSHLEEVFYNSDYSSLGKIVARLKNSNSPHVVEAAISAAFDLQNLPHQTS